jgi:hypothetical protein
VYDTQNARPDHPQLGSHLRDYIVDVNATGLLLIFGVVGVCGMPVLALFAAAGESAIAVVIFITLGFLGAAVGWRGFKQYRIYKRYPALSTYTDGALVGLYSEQVPLEWQAVDRDRIRVRAGSQIVFVRHDDTNVTTVPVMQARSLMIDIDAQIHRQRALAAYQKNPDGVLLELPLANENRSIMVYGDRLELPDGNVIPFDAVTSIRQTETGLVLDLNDGQGFSSDDFRVKALAVLETIFIDSIICERLVPMWVSELEAGNAVQFSEVRVRHDGVDTEDFAITWEQIAAEQAEDGLDGREDALGRQVHAEDFVEFSWLLTYMIDRESFDRRIRVLDFVGW